MSEVLYDKKGREIMHGDILKVFHFIGARFKKHYMYKQVDGIIYLGKEETPYLVINHLDKSNTNYLERLNGRFLKDYEIVQGVPHEDDRAKHKEKQK